MRKLTIQLTATFTLLLIAAFALQSFKPREAKAATWVPVDFVVNTSSGCSVNIRGSVTYTTPPLVVSWASGMVAFTGNCGTSRPGADLIFDIVTDGKLKIIDIKWNVPEDPKLEVILSDPEIEDAFIAYLQQLLI
jgi:hypothetical protein